MARPRKHRKPPNLFVVSSATAEVGTGLDADGHAATPVLRLNLLGRWTAGNVQTIACLMELDLAPELADLVGRVAAKAIAEKTTDTAPAT